MDGVNEPNENGKVSNLWTKVAKLAKPQGRKWHFTLKNKLQFLSLWYSNSKISLVKNNHS
ncbi:hypothetical protein HanXRQr2_Chr17g0787771 [Helianthus annuus]|uniref:Uncharacterized protein n=1 Tax=Helianthus annuus TaxID=4232 RepID=A0A9K3DGC6_HELAN|nr:hypothetical protein HanXRQr2_Chr17g0787771 [Helianthus annuus]